MSSFFFMVVAFLAALAILISVHELGHFLVARYFGVKILRFSIGFGKPLIKWQSKRGTEYVLAVFPLGGYVKMLDESEAPVPEEEKAFAFNYQSLGRRTAIVAAGPVFNWLFAVFAFWLMFTIGISSLIPIIGEVTPDSIAAKAGLEPGYQIKTVAGQQTKTWQAIQLALISRQGQQSAVNIQLEAFGTSDQIQRSLDLYDWHLGKGQANILESIGILPYLPPNAPIIAEVLPDLAADQAGFQVNDEIIAVDQQEINDWLEFVNYVQSHPEDRLTVTVNRLGQLLTLTVKPERLLDDQNNPYGFIGLTSQRLSIADEFLTKEQYNPLQAFSSAMRETASLTLGTFKIIGKIILAKVALQNLSGPVGIAQGAGQSAEAGFAYFLGFLALLSISLAVLNVLPIPILDGGHLFYYLIEFIRGRPLSQKVREAGFKAGLIFIIMLMFIALGNDLIRLVD